MKVFQIGFNRCGTRSIHQYFAANGISSVHWDEGRLAQRMFENRANGNDLLAGYPEFDVFTDMESLDGIQHLEAYKLYPELAAQYPDAVFILNTRDREAWINSRFGHRKGEYAARFKQYLGTDSDAELADAWRRDWDAHHARVVEFFSGKPHRFFICRIETDLPDLLNEKIPEFRLDRKLYSLQGRSRLPPPPRPALTVQRG